MKNKIKWILGIIVLVLVVGVAVVFANPQLQQGFFRAIPRLQQPSITKDTLIIQPEIRPVSPELEPVSPEIDTEDEVELALQAFCKNKISELHKVRNDLTRVSASFTELFDPVTGELTGYQNQYETSSLFSFNGLEYETSPILGPSELKYFRYTGSKNNFDTAYYLLRSTQNSYLKSNNELLDLCKSRGY